MDLLDRLTAGWRAYALIALVALLAVLPGFASIPVTDRDEARFAQATRQMLETGDFVRINVQDEPRNKKPIGIHWMQAGAVALTEPITGNLNTIWAYRIPSLLGAIIAALAAFWGGIPAVGRRAAAVCWPARGTGVPQRSRRVKRRTGTGAFRAAQSIAHKPGGGAAVKATASGGACPRRASSEGEDARRGQAPLLANAASTSSACPGTRTSPGR